MQDARKWILCVRLFRCARNDDFHGMEKHKMDYESVGKVFLATLEILAKQNERRRESAIVSPKADGEDV